MGKSASLTRLEKTSAPPPGESLEAKWWPDRDLGRAFRRWTSIPPARGEVAKTVAIKFLVEHLSVSELTAVGTAPRTPAPVVEPPDFAIMNCIEQHDIDLVVMGTVGRAGISGFITGNTAERLLPRIPCSLLAVKPPDYNTPVSLD